MQTQESHISGFDVLSRRMYGIKEDYATQTLYFTDSGHCHIRDKSANSLEYVINTLTGTLILSKCVRKGLKIIIMNNIVLKANEIHFN